MRLPGVSCLLLTAIFACDKPASQSSARESARQARSEVDALRALPYAGFAVDAADGESGVVLAEKGEFSPGLTLICVAMASMAQLLADNGTVTHEWHHPGLHWAHVSLLPDGSIVTIGTDTPASQTSTAPTDRQYALRLDWNGSVGWKKHLPAHHDISSAPAGRFVTLVHDLLHDSEIHPDADTLNEHIVLLGQDGETLDRLSVLDSIRASAGRFPLGRVAPARVNGRDIVDLFRCNSVEWVRHAALAERGPIYSPDNVLVCFRHQNRVAIFNWKQQRVVWTWGDGELDGPHDARLLENGHIVLFDNGLVRGWSRVIELDPLTGDIVWQYQRPRKHEFYSRSGGGVQALPGGNFLITNSDHGEVFEVTRAGKPVWRYFTPLTNSRGQRYSIVRATRYPHEYVESARGSAESASESK